MNPGDPSAPGSAGVFEMTMYRRRGSKVLFAPEPFAGAHPTVRRPAHVARMLALAHHVESAIERGLFPDRAAVARKLGLTRARITQLLNLLLLAPELQQCVLSLEAVDGVEPMSERAVRSVASALSWTEQKAAWTRLIEASKS